jgi:hypothetical protein
MMEELANLDRGNALSRHPVGLELPERMRGTQSAMVGGSQQTDPLAAPGLRSIPTT